MEQLVSVPREALMWEYQSTIVTATALEDLEVGDLCVFDMGIEGNSTLAPEVFTGSEVTSPFDTFDRFHPFNFVRSADGTTFDGVTDSLNALFTFCVPVTLPSSDATPGSGGAASEPSHRAGQKGEFLIQGLVQVQVGAAGNFGKFGVMTSGGSVPLVDDMHSDVSADPMLCVAHIFDNATTNFELAWVFFDGLYGFGTTATQY